MLHVLFLLIRNGVQLRRAVLRVIVAYIVPIVLIVAIHDRYSVSVAVVIALHVARYLSARTGIEPEPLAREPSGRYLIFRLHIDTTLTASIGGRYPALPGTRGRVQAKFPIGLYTVYHRFRRSQALF